MAETAMELDPSSIPRDSILLTGDDSIKPNTAEPLTTGPFGAESEGNVMSSETANTAPTEPLRPSEGQLVRVKQEPSSPPLSPQTSELGTDSAIPQLPQSDIDVEEAIRAHLSTRLIEWPGPQEEAQETKPEKPLAQTGAPKNTKEEAVEDDMFVDALPNLDTVDAGNAERDDLVFLGGSDPRYAWANINDTSEFSARIVEEAVDVALTAGQQVANVLKTSASRETRVNATHWVKEFESIEAAHRKFEVHVGVSGATGAGKTTMINALLDFEELLPSGSDGAATATACVVHLNTEDHPGKHFRAAIHFKTQKEIRDWLEPLLADVRGYYRSQGMNYDSDDDTTTKARKSCAKVKKEKESKAEEGEEDEDEDDEGGSEEDDDYIESDGDDAKASSASAAFRDKTRERRRKAPVYVIDDESDEDFEEDDEYREVDASELRDKLRSFTAVFGLDLNDLRDVKLEDLLDRDEHPIIRFLETTKQVFAGSKNAFAHKIRPFLDSSPLPDDELPNCNGKGGTEDDDSNDISSGSDFESDSGQDSTPGSSDYEAGDTVDSLVDMLGRHRKTTDLQVWPLVSHVDLYVPSKLLEGGIVLEDLPGLADQMEERVKVAHSRFRNLDATIIVAPANRAGDEAICMQLISENEALRMRFDNQLNERTFCVVTSRIDDFEWLKYLTQASVKPDSDLGQWCREYQVLDSFISICEKDISDAKESLAASETHIDMASIAGDDTELKMLKHACSLVETRLKELEAQHELLKDCEQYYRNLLAYHASQMRNRRVQAKIQEAYTRMRASATDKLSKTAARAKRGLQKETRPQPDDQAKAATLDVMPISALAYWNMQDSKNKLKSAGLKEGFPDVAYTGIPALRAWIRYAVVPARIRHGISMLRRLNVLLHNLKTGFDMQQPTFDKTANPSKFLGDLMSNFQETLVLNLELGSQEIIEWMRGCNPLQKLKGENKNFTPKCRGAMIEEVKYWDCRNHPLEEDGPKAKRSRNNKRKSAGSGVSTAQVPAGHILGPNGKPAKMAWATHLAIIRRGGAEYISGGIYRAKYDWMGGLARLSLSEVVQQWEACFHHEIPKHTENVRGYLENIWTQSLIKIGEVLPICCTDPSERGYLAVQLEAMRAIRDSVIDGVQQAMLKLVEQAKGIHPVVEQILVKGWQKAFIEATRMSGKGSFKMRQSHLVKHAHTVMTRLIKKAIQSMDHQIAANIEAFALQLEELWSSAKQMIQNHISSIVRKTDPTATIDAGRANDPLSNDRCRVINDFIFTWETNWKFSDAQTKMSRHGGEIACMAFPDQYLPKPERFDELDLSAADEAEAYNEDCNDLGLDEVPGPKRRRKMVVDEPCNRGRGREGKAGGKGKKMTTTKKPPATKKTPSKRSQKK